MTPLPPLLPQTGEARLPFAHHGDLVAFVKKLRRFEKLTDAVDAMIDLLKLSAGSAQAPETPSLLARCLAAIETAITDEDGLDGVVGERLLREAGYWPPDPYAASSSDEQAEGQR